MTRLETERLILRNMEEKDYEDVYEYSKTPNVGPNAGWEPHKSKEESLEIMKLLFLDQENVWGIELKENGKIIGSLGLIGDPKRENDRVLMLGYALGERYWGKGIMSEAVKKVLEYAEEKNDIDYVSAYTYPFNERSKKILKKSGFSYEGTLKAAEKIYNGEIYDNDCYILKVDKK